MEKYFFRIKKNRSISKIEKKRFLSGCGDFQIANLLICQLLHRNRFAGNPAR